MIYVIIKCDPRECGADSVKAVYGTYETEDEALEVLAGMRDDDPELGNGWTYFEVQEA